MTRGALSWIILSVTAFAGAAWPAGPPPIQLTLEGSVALAIRNSVTVKKARNNSKLSATQVLQGYGQFLPDLNVRADYSYNWGRTIYTFYGVSIVDSTNRAADYQIGSTLNLFNGLADYSALKSAIAQRAAADLTLEWAKKQVALDVTQSYLQVILDERIIAIAASNLQASDGRLKLLRGQSEVGQASPADLLRQEAQRSADELYLINSRTKFNDDKLILIRKLELDTAKDYELVTPSLAPTPPPMAKLSEEELIREALEQRQDLQAQASTVDANEWSVKTARAGYFPRLDLTFFRLADGRYLLSQFVDGNYSVPPGQTSLIPQLGQQVSYSVALTLSWNLFDHFLTRLDVERAQVNSENSGYDYDDLRIGVIGEVRQVRADYLAAVSQLKTTQVGLAAAQKALEAVSGQYQVGAESFIDLLAAQSALVQAQASQAQALVNLRLQGSLFEFYLGRPPF